MRVTSRFPSPFGVLFLLTQNRQIMRVTSRFPSPFGVLFLLTKYLSLLDACITMFPSPFGVLFLLTKALGYKYPIILVSVPFRGSIPSNINLFEFNQKIIGFPSPFGVLFLLTFLLNILKVEKCQKFPSPFGVLFLLTFILGSVCSNLYCFRPLSGFYSF